MTEKEELKSFPIVPIYLTMRGRKGPAEGSISLIGTSFQELSEDEISKLTNIPKKDFAGHIYIPERSYTKNLIESADKLNDFMRQWAKEIDFHLMDVEILVMPSEKYGVDWVEIHGSLSGSNDGKQPVMDDIFPRTEFVDKNYSISGSFGVSASTKFDAWDNIATTKMEGVLNVRFEYKPRTAKIMSGVAGSRFSCAFRAAKGEQPVGGLRLLGTILRPRTLKTMSVAWNVQVKFARRLVPGPFGDKSLPIGGRTILEFASS